MKNTMLVATLVATILPALTAITRAGEFDALISSLDHQDKQIREAARNQLLDENNDATPALVNAVLEPANAEKLASAAAVVLIERLSLLKDRRNTTDRTKPYINLRESDKQQLRPLVNYVRMSAGGPSWRWYLAASILDEVDAAALLDAIPALNAVLAGQDAMRQYAAVRAIYHVADQEQAKQTSPALIDLLYRPRSPFYGLFLRGNRLLDENLLSYAHDVRVYDDVDMARSYERRPSYYSHGDLLISAALIRLGATYEEIGPRLVDLACRYNSSTRLHAARQLAKLGPPGQQAAAATLAQMLYDHDPYLLRRIADEHPSFVGSVRVDHPTEQLKSIAAFLNLGESTKWVVAPLTGVLLDGDYRVRHVAAQLLGVIGKHDRAVAIEGLQRSIAQEIVAPLVNLMQGVNVEVSDKAAAIYREISQQRKVVSVGDLRSIRESLAFDNPPRPSQKDCFDAMLNALVELQKPTED